MDKNDKRMGRRMLAVYRETDHQVAERADTMKATCGKGCFDCCHLLVSITFPEAVALAEHLLTDPTHAMAVKTLAARLHAQIAVINEGIRTKDPGLYFRSKLPCTLLDPQTKTCTVYAHRPSTCRLHYVVSDPALCSPSVEGATMARINMEDIGLYHLDEALRISRQTGTPLWSGPFQIMLLWALKLLSEGRQSIELAHATTNLGIMSLKLWRMSTNDTPSEIPPPAEAPPDGGREVSSDD